MRMPEHRFCRSALLAACLGLTLTAAAQEMPRSGIQWPSTAGEGGAVEGVQRLFATEGHLQRLTFVKEGRTVLAMGFLADGSLSELRCGQRSWLPQDQVPCGHAGTVSEVTLFRDVGLPSGRVRHLAGQLLFQAVLDERGQNVRTEEVSGGHRIKRVFYRSGQLRSEADFIERDPGVGPGREGVAREWAESGQLTQETLWVQGRERRIRQWYLNGQLKMQQTIEWLGRHQRRATESFWESGAPAAVNAERNGALLGWQKYFDERGVLRREEEHGDRGVLLRRKRYDAQGVLEQDERRQHDGARI